MASNMFYEEYLEFDHLNTFIFKDFKGKKTRGSPLTPLIIIIMHPRVNTLILH